ncbi:uncharacterized protein IWZ02DRAFT_217943 [Phyllosticta citriasiana]|uniref:uncharacterized protein n=1 Tax=Phyllosticta citriasiana TaxID=595635 RepID=UPI0030FD73B8
MQCTDKQGCAGRSCRTAGPEKPASFNPASSPQPRLSGREKFPQPCHHLPVASGNAMWALRRREIAKSFMLPKPQRHFNTLLLLVVVGLPRSWPTIGTWSPCLNSLPLDPGNPFSFFSRIPFGSHDPEGRLRQHLAFIVVDSSVPVSHDSCRFDMLSNMCCGWLSSAAPATRPSTLGPAQTSAQEPGM